MPDPGSGCRGDARVARGPEGHNRGRDRDPSADDRPDNAGVPLRAGSRPGTPRPSTPHVAAPGDVSISKHRQFSLTVRPADAVICLGCCSSLASGRMRPPVRNRGSEAYVGASMCLGEPIPRCDSVRRSSMTSASANRMAESEQHVMQYFPYSIRRRRLAGGITRIVSSRFSHKTVWTALRGGTGDG
jgi:hypothetical protein